MNSLICPTCRTRQLALWECPDGVHRCWYCKAVPKAAPTPAPAPAPNTPPEYERLLRAQVAIRNKITAIEAVSGWDRSAWNAGKHEGLSEALAVLKEAAK